MSKEVVLITAYNGKGELLVGKRNDNGLYTLSGGHLEPGESPEVGALRELYEETGLHAVSLSFLKDYTTADGVRLHCFSAYVTGIPHGNGDPDREVDEWEFVDVRDGLPSKVYNHLHGPTPDSGDNIVTQLFDLKKAEDDLEKREPNMFTSDDWGTSQISIPSSSHPARPAYDKGYESAIRQRYGNKLKRIQVPTSSVEPINEVQDKSRFNLYRKMARKDRLPPIVVQRTSTGFKALDGNHKYHAAVAEGVPEMDAFEVRKSEDDLTKAEDEVGRMLDHPNPAERTLALKLGSVTPRHLQFASLDPDPAVHQAAIDHPAFGAAQGMHLMEATAGKDGKPPTAQQLAFLSRTDKVEPYHLTALKRSATPETFDQISNACATHPNADGELLGEIYRDPMTLHGTRLATLGHANASEEILEHALGAGSMIPSSEAAELARKAVEHPRVTPERVTTLARNGLDRGGALQSIAEHALEHHAPHPDLYTTLFQRALLQPSGGSASMLGALERGPGGMPEHIDEIAAKLHPSTHPSALQGPNVKPQHLDRAVAWAHSNLDQATMSKLMDSKAFGPRHLDTLLQKTEPLEKAVKPEHFKSLTRASDPEGAKMVDHAPDLMAHPPGHGPEVEAYHNNVLKHPKAIGPKRTYESDSAQGVSRKKVFYAAVAGQKEPGKFMVKPYHERVIRRAKTWQKFPIQGWAEMTNQALYHAGEIGHLHQNVHVAEHDMGPGHEKEPALVVSLKPGQREQHISGPLRGEPHGEDVAQHHTDARKIAMMDMLSNNLDRHGGNLLQGGIEDKLGGEGGNSLLAVDHSRSFQYIQPNTKTSKEIAAPKYGPLTDTFARYHTQSSVNHASPFLPAENLPENATPSQYTNQHYDRHMQALQSYQPVFDWWGKVGQNVRNTFHQRLDQIKDPQVRAHLKRNFDARADWLDERARMGIENYGVTDWHKDGIPMHRPGQLTDDEQEEQERNARLRR